MLPFQEDKMKKASESILNYTEVLAATYKEVRSDLLVAAVWYCLKEEQKKIEMLEEALRKQTGDKTPEVVQSRDAITDKGKDSGQKKLKRTPNESKRLLNTSVPEDFSNNAVSKNKPVAADNNEKTNIDSNVCIIEIDDDDDDDVIVEKIEGRAIKIKKHNNTQQKNRKTAKRMKDPEIDCSVQTQKSNKSMQKALKTVSSKTQNKKDQNNLVEKDKSVPIQNGKIGHVEKDQKVKSDTNDSSEHEELFDMDCEEIHDEPLSKMLDADENSDKIIRPSEKISDKTTDFTEISDEENAPGTKKKSKILARNKGQSKSKKIKTSIQKNTEEKNLDEDCIDEINVIVDEEQEEPCQSRTVMETDVKSASEIAESDETGQNTEKSEETPFPTALTQNIADRTDNAVEDVEKRLVNETDSEAGFTTRQNYTTIVSQDKDIPETTVNINANVNTDQYTMIPQSRQNVEVNFLDQVNISDPFGCPNSIRDNQHLTESLPVTTFKTEMDFGNGQCLTPSPVQSMVQPERVQGLASIQGEHPGFHDIAPSRGNGMPLLQEVQVFPAHQGLSLGGQKIAQSGFPNEPFSQRIQGMAPATLGYLISTASYTDPSFSQSPYLSVNSDLVSLSSLTSGALTYPYRTTEAVVGLYGSRPLQEIGQAGYFGPTFQQELGHQPTPGPDFTDQGGTRGKPVETVSPPTKKRLLDFDKKWNAGPTTSKRQEKYMASASNVVLPEQSPWNEGQARITEMEWALRLNCYNSISNHITPPLVGTEVTQSMVQTETVGMSLDDIGFHGHTEDELDKDQTGEKKKSRYSNVRGQGRRGRGLKSGRGSRGASRGRQEVKQVNGLKGKRNQSFSQNSSKGSPQQARQFSFYRQGRSGYSQTKVRGCGQLSKTDTDGMKMTGRRQASMSNVNTSGVSKSRSRNFRKRGSRERGVKTRSQS